MTDDVIPDLNTTIASAVQARVTAEVAAALSGDDTFGALVVAALQQPVEVETRLYHKEKVPYLHAVLRKTIQEAAKGAVAEMAQEEMPRLREAVRKAIRRNIDPIADAMTTNLLDSTTQGWGINVQLDLRVPNRD